MLKKSKPKHTVRTPLQNIYRWKIGIALLSLFLGLIFFTDTVVSPCGQAGRGGSRRYEHGVCISSIDRTVSKPYNPYIIGGAAFGVTFMITAFSMRKRRYEPGAIRNFWKTLRDAVTGKRHIK